MSSSVSAAPDDASSSSTSALRTPVKPKSSGSGQPSTPLSHAAATQRGQSADGPKKGKKVANYEDRHPFHVFSFPLYGMGTFGERVFVGGGGGGAKTGVPNMWAAFTWDAANARLRLAALVDAGPAVVTNGAVSPRGGHVAVGRAGRVALAALRDGAAHTYAAFATADAAAPGAADDDAPEQKAVRYLAADTLLTGSSDGKVRVWRVKTAPAGDAAGAEANWDGGAREMLIEHSLGADPVTDLAVSADPDGKTVTFAAVSARQFGVWSLTGTRVTLLLKAAPEIPSLQYRGVDLLRSGAALTLLVGVVSRAQRQSWVYRFAVGNAQPLQRTLMVRGDALTALRASPDGVYLAVGTADGRVDVYCTATFGLVMRTTPHSFFVSGVSFSPDSRAVLSCSGDRTLAVQRVVQQRGWATLFMLLVALIVVALAVWLARQ